MTIIEKTGIYISILIIVILLFFIVFSKHGVMDYRHLKQRQAAVFTQIRIVDTKNLKLENEVKSLKTDINYIKHVAKQEHDMAEKDELIFKDKSKR